MSKSSEKPVTESSVSTKSPDTTPKVEARGWFSWLWGSSKKPETQPKAPEVDKTEDKDKARANQEAQQRKDELALVVRDSSVAEKRLSFTGLGKTIVKSPVEDELNSMRGSGRLKIAKEAVKDVIQGAQLFMLKNTALVLADLTKGQNGLNMAQMLALKSRQKSIAMAKKEEAAHSASSSSSSSVVQNPEVDQAPVDKSSAKSTLLSFFGSRKKEEKPVYMVKASEDSDVDIAPKRKKRVVEDGPDLNKELNDLFSGDEKPTGKVYKFKAKKQGKEKDESISK